jgi:hypothetical protein
VINFRYHIVSLMAVFLALAVGIAAGVSIGAPVEKGVLDQAGKDRDEVTALRAEIDRRKVVDQYRQSYEQQAGAVLAGTVLAGTRVAVVAMPDAPAEVVQALTTATTRAGGTVVREVQLNEDVFDPTTAEEVADALGGPETASLNFGAETTPATRVGRSLARSIADKTVGDRDPLALQLDRRLTGAGLATISDSSPAWAQLVLVVSATASTPAVPPAVVEEHLQVDLALQERAGVVLAGPNSTGLEGTDVLAARNNAAASSRVSTVDVADLSSGVTTTLLAGKEQLGGRLGRHYGALAQADAVLPELPVR